MLSITEIQDILNRIKYSNWKLHLGFRGVDEGVRMIPFIQWQFMAPDNDNPSAPMTLQKGRKWKLSYHMTHQEIERTAYLAVRQAVLHELDEQYTYRGVAIRNPHIDPDVLVQVVSNADNLISRPDARISH